MGAHLCSHTSELPSRFASLGWDDAFSAELLSNVLMIAFTIKLCVRHYRPNALSIGRDLIKQPWQGGAVVGGDSMGFLCQDHVPVHIDRQQPFEPVAKRRGCDAVLLTPANEKCANGTRGQSGRVYGYRPPPRSGRRRFAPLQPTHHFTERFGDHLLIQAKHETKQRTVIRHALQLERSSEFFVLEQAHFCRSEEHTSELQSRENLVCRLLLEKKKKHKDMNS